MGRNNFENCIEINWNFSKEQAVELAEKLFRTEMEEQISFCAEDGSGEVYSKRYKTTSASLFSNENNAWLLKFEPQDWKKVLCIAGSGDQIIDFALYGARDITGVDINAVQMPIVITKIMLILNCNYFEFVRYMHDAHSADCMDLKMLKKVLKSDSPALKATLAFWERLYELSKKEAKSKGLSVQEYVRINFLLGERNFLMHGSDRITHFRYLYNLSEYENAKKGLSRLKLNLIIGDVFKDDIGSGYTCMHLSNLHDFIDEYVDGVTALYERCVPNAKFVHYGIQFPYEMFKTSQEEEAEKYVLDVVKKCNSEPVVQQARYMLMKLWYEIKTFASEYTTELCAFESGLGYNAFYDYHLDAAFIHQI